MASKNLPMTERVTVAQDYADLSKRVAQLVVEQLTSNPDSSLGMPVGKSLVGCYEILAKRSEQKQINWQQAKCFALDDYLEVEEPYSFKTFLETKLYQHINIVPKHCFNPRFQDNYDQTIADNGGLDFCILGLGTNGHIAFNEPGTPKASWTHCVWLSEATKKANKDYFVGTQKVATKAITMGISTILASRKIVLVVTGNGKKEALKKMLMEPANEALPASLLQMHSGLRIITDFHYQS